RLRLQLHRLALPLARGQRAVRDHRTARRQPLDLAVVVGKRRRGHDLQRIEARAVVDVNEREPRLGVSPGANPSADGHGRANRNGPLQNRLNLDAIAAGHDGALSVEYPWEGESWTDLARLPQEPRRLRGDARPGAAGRARADARRRRR